MIEDRLIICIASNWELDPTSKHHLMRILSQRNDVLWINYHGSRRPQLNRHDAGAAFNALKRVTRGLTPVHDRLHHLTPLVLPGAPAPWRQGLNRRLVIQQIRRAARSVRRRPDQPVQLWTFAPDVDYLVGAFGEECCVYYCVDEFSEFNGFDATAIAAAERRLMARADVVIATSQKLYARRKELHPNVHLVRHGVQVEHFAQAVGGELPVPAELADIPRPTAGFIGLVQHWFDAELVAGVARRLPDVSFVVVGDCQVDVSRLAALDNVHLVGRRPYAELPAWCAGFDVGLIPFVRSSMTENVNPIKLREYLAAGLPVVSTSLPEVRAFAPAVTLADDVESFAAACRTAIMEDTPTARAARSAGMADHCWDAVTARVESIVSEASLTSFADV